MRRWRRRRRAGWRSARALRGDILWSVRRLTWLWLRLRDVACRPRSAQQLLVSLDHLGLLSHHVLDLRAGEQLEIFAGLLHLLPKELVLERLGEGGGQRRDAVVRHLRRGHGVPDLVDGGDAEAELGERGHVGQRLLARLAGDGEEVQALAHARARAGPADGGIDVAAHDRRISLARALEVHHAERQVQFLLQRGELDVARARPPDGADHDAAFFAFVDELLEGLDRRILLHAELPAHHAPAVDRREVDRLVARSADDLVDGAAGRGFGHHHVAVGPRGVELGARHAPARPQHVFEAGLDPVLLEIGLDDARRGVDRSAGRLVDDPVDLARGEHLLRAERDGWHAQAAGGRGAERKATRIAQDSAPADPRIAVHLQLLITAPGAATAPRPVRARFDTRSVPAPRPATQAPWYG